MCIDSCVFLRRFTGLTLWWMALISGFFSAPSTLFYAVSGATFLFWLIAQILKKRLFYTFFEVLYTLGIVGIIYLTEPFYIISAAIWGVTIVAAIAFIAFLRAHEQLLQTIDYNQIESINSQKAQYPKAFPRFIIYYLAWIIGILFIVTLPGLWQPVILAAWSCFMLFVGYQHIWPFSLHPEWLGYRMRRTVFVSKRRWIARFIVAFLLVAGTVAMMTLYFIL